MQPQPTEISLEIKPHSRFAVIDVTQRLIKEFGDVLAPYRKALYCSLHTTAGYLEDKHSNDHVEPLLGAFQNLFPPEADYRHDQLELRKELSDEERQCEPKNADSHLIFISAGMKNCVTYENEPGQPVYFIDLDGVNGKASRSRRTTVVGFNEERAMEKTTLSVPVSKHPVDSINLKDARLGLCDELNDLVKHLDIRHGRIDIELPADEQNAGLTVNEYETLLMKHDFAEVVQNPFKHMAIKGKHALAAPKLIPGKTLDYAKYDLVHLFNELMDKMGVSETVIERLLSAFIRLPASHFLSMKRHISLFVSQDNGDAHGKIVLGKYQSPILVQWDRARRETRNLNVTISKFQ
jgi:thiamine phosphate synthase YjbQ (UPF0047 family)